MESMLAMIDCSLSKVPTWLTTVRRPEPPYGRYRYYASSPKDWCVYASLEGIAVENLLGLAAFWTEAQRREALSGLSDAQCPDGHYRCPCCAADDGDPRQRCAESNADGITFKVAVTLYGFGLTPRHPLPTGTEMGKGEIRPDDVAKWLAATFENNNPYSAGSMVWKACGMRSLRLLSDGKEPMADPVVARILDWLLKNQDPATGLWFHKGDLLNGVNGLLKMRFGTFDLAGIDIPHPEKIIPVILSIQHEDGSFGGACCDWNCVGLLAEIGRRAPRYRDDIIAAYRRALPVILGKQTDAGWFRWTDEPDEEPFLKSTFVNLHGVLSIKRFLLKDDAGIDQIFGNLKQLRKQLL